MWGVVYFVARGTLPEVAQPTARSELEIADCMFYVSTYYLREVEHCPFAYSCSGAENRGLEVDYSNPVPSPLAVRQVGPTASSSMSASTPNSSPNQMVGSLSCVLAALSRSELGHNILTSPRVSQDAQDVSFCKAYRVHAGGSAGSRGNHRRVCRGMLEHAPRLTSSVG